MKTRFDQDSARDYEFANGCKPRGSGNWMFDVVWSDGRGAYTSEQFSFNGSFTEAKRFAMGRARADAPGAATEATVSVCS